MVGGQVEDVVGERERSQGIQYGYRDTAVVGVVVQRSLVDEARGTAGDGRGQDQRSS